jgi:hypothetical protein
MEWLCENFKADPAIVKVPFGQPTTWAEEDVDLFQVNAWQFSCVKFLTIKGYGRW